MKKLSKFFNLKITELEQNKTLSLMDNVRRCPEQFGKKIIFLVTEVNFFDKFLRNKFIYFPSIIKLIFYSIKQKKEINPQSTQVEERIKVGFDFPDDFMDNLNIKSNVNMVFEKELKTIKKYFENETILKKENLKKKIIYDFNYLFNQQNQNYPFVNKIETISLDLKEKNLDELITYFKSAIQLLESISVKIESEKQNKIIANVSSRLEKLIDNVFSSNIYSLVFKKIPEIISNIFFNYIKNEILKFKTDLNEMDKH